jgi:hypothetical protein
MFEGYGRCGEKMMDKMKGTLDTEQVAARDSCQSRSPKYIKERLRSKASCSGTFAAS